MTAESTVAVPGVLLALDNIGKTYVAPVLGGVALTIVPGQVLALTGENGAGKSTLSKIICGLEQATTGAMLLDGQPYQPASRTAAEALGIRMVMQELNLIPTLSIAENLYLNDLPHRFGWIDRIAVLRDGELVCDDDIADHSSSDLVRLMVGRSADAEIDMSGRTIGAPLMRVRELGRKGVVQPISFDLRAGEILGIAGLIGSGRTELLRLIFGADKADEGGVYFGDSDKPTVIDSPRAAVKAGIAMITEDRKGQGLLLSQSIAINTTLATLGSVNTGGWLDHGAETDIADDYVKRLGIRSRNSAQSVSELSGGNQQKVVIARWLYRDCPVMLFDEPTRGIDIGAKFDIYNVLADLARQGKGLVIVSSDLRELMLICDRIAVMSAGRIADTFERGAWSQDTLLSAAFSGYMSSGTNTAQPAGQAAANPTAAAA
jgi:ribose transport system ATP-binding protein